MYLPPPTDHSLFSEAKEINLSKDHKRILHIGGKKAAKDRNGTDSIFEMIKHSKEDYEIVIKSQTKFNSMCKDPRVKIEIANTDDRQDMYKGFDAMVLPRRYAGLCLPMNEALMSGIPVFMTDISPNNAILPSEWLVESTVIDRFRTKSLVDVYDVNPKKLAKIIDDYIKDSDKVKILPIAKMLIKIGFRLVATKGTAKFLAENGVIVTIVNKITEEKPHVVDMIASQEISLIINTTAGAQSTKDSFSIRRTALMKGVTYATTISGADAMVQAIAACKEIDNNFTVRAIQDLANI
jgi:hypothetical protein